jgi:diguanylate cyclase (GGDEF)-like protein
VTGAIASSAQRAKQLIVPEGMFLLFVMVLLRWDYTSAAVASAAPLYAVAVFVAGVLLAWRFHRSRVVFALLVLAVAALAVQHLVAVDQRVPSAPATVLHGVAFLLPLNLLGITLLDERGLLTAPGVLRLAAVVLQVVLVAALAYPVPSPAAHWLERQLLPFSIAHVTPLAQPALVVFAVAGLWLTVQLSLRPAAATRGFLWALAASFLALHSAYDTSSAQTYFATAGLILAVGVIEATYFMAYRDGLTGLPARRAFNEALPQLGNQYSIAMVDVDYFKKFNDEHGHDVGDQVLRMVAKHIGQVAGGGKAYRYGGEEFAILFPGKRRDDSLHHLERVREAVEQAVFTLRGRRRPRTKPATPPKRKSSRGNLSVTVSIGVAERSARYTTPDRVVKAADRALYRAKTGGRNRIRR